MPIDNLINLINNEIANIFDLFSGAIVRPRVPNSAPSSENPIPATNRAIAIPTCTKGIEAFNYFRIFIS